MIERPERLLSTILLGNNLVNVAFAVVMTVLIVDRLEEGSGVAVATAVATGVGTLYSRVPIHMVLPPMTSLLASRGPTSR